MYCLLFSITCMSLLSLEIKVSAPFGCFSLSFLKGLLRLPEAIFLRLVAPVCTQDTPSLASGQHHNLLHHLEQQ